jgi:hypothetical protein
MKATRRFMIVLVRFPTMKRQARLKAAKIWLATYNGKNKVKGYRRKFGVDIVCAIKELEMCGVKLSADYKKSALASHQAHCEKQKLRRENKKREAENAMNPFPPDLYGQEGGWDDHHAFIAGFTSWGFSFGTTWEQWYKMNPENEAFGESAEQDVTQEHQTECDFDTPRMIY